MPCHFLEGDLEMWQMFGWTVQITGGFHSRLYLSLRSLNLTLLWQCLGEVFYLLPAVAALTICFTFPLSSIPSFSVISPPFYPSLSWLAQNVTLALTESQCRFLCSCPYQESKMDPDTFKEQSGINTFISQQSWLWHFANIWLLIYY